MAKTETMMLTGEGGGEEEEGLVREVDEAETQETAATAAPAKFRIRFIVAVDVDSYWVAWGADKDG